MRFVPNAVAVRTARAALHVQKHSPTLLFGAGVISAAASTVLACKATLKVEDVLEDHNKKIEQIHHGRELDIQDYTERDFQRDRVVLFTQTSVKLVKLYTPAVGLGFVAVACLTGSHKILTSRNAALGAAYAAVERSFNDYRARVINEYGEDKDHELRFPREEVDSIVVTDPETGKKTKATKGTAVKRDAQSLYSKFFDETNPNWKPNPEANLIFLDMVQKYANDRLRARGHLFLNEVYDHLGIERTGAGAVVGWVISREGTGDNYVDFGLSDVNSESARRFINGIESAVLLDFNVDGVIYDKI